MTELSAFLAAQLTPIVANIGALATIAWVLSIYSHSTMATADGKPRLNPWLVGICMGATASLLMFIPVELTPGIIADGRGAPILLSGIIGGPIAAITTAMIAGVCRFLIGGTAYISGPVYIAIFALIGLAYWYVEQKQESPRLGILRLFVISTVGTVISILCLLFIPAEIRINVLIKLWPILWVSNVIGTIILGTLLVRERERMKNEYQLAIQFERAEQATVAKSRFIAAMSHEIRTPLNAVLGILQLLDTDEVSGKVREKLKVAHDSGRFLLSLINQVLDFARIEANSIVPTKDTFTLSSLIDSLHSVFDTQARAKGLGLEFFIEGDAQRPLVGSLAHIQQILFNFLGNAVKFTDSGSITLRASLSEGKDGALLARLSVTDTGPGMKKADTEVIFEEFGQVGFQSKKSAGTGLGLSISKSLAIVMNADIGVDTAPGEGATFTLDVPLAAGEETNLISEGAVETPSNSLNILVAEDNDINQMIIKAMLKKDNHIVTVVDDGAKAVQAVHDNETPFDLILMDIQMPVMDGKEATRRLREIEPCGTKLPIVAVTANAFSDQRDEYLEAGMQGVVIKPIDANKLQAAIKSAVSS